MSAYNKNNCLKIKETWREYEVPKKLMLSTELPANVLLVRLTDQRSKEVCLRSY